MDSNSKIKKYHKRIANALEKTSTSLRKLDELTYHYYKSEDFFLLKETVSNIENFLLLFNPNNKYDLCRYWQKLEEKGFDPAIEYNKAIEGFEIHYHPESEKTFLIILQISRFLKEFSDFETDYTPVFRHPPIMASVFAFDLLVYQLFLKADPIDEDGNRKQFGDKKNRRNFTESVSDIKIKHNYGIIK